MSKALEIGAQFVQLVNDGKEAEVLDTLFSPKIVSIEGQGTEEMPARMEGIDAIRGKHQWWYDNHEVHSTGCEGPFVGNREDQFAVEFTLDATQKANGERMQMKEVGLYTVEGDKIVQEEFLYLMAQ